MKRLSENSQTKSSTPVRKSVNPETALSGRKLRNSGASNTESASETNDRLNSAIQSRIAIRESMKLDNSETDANDLKIENDRLKTSVDILTKKLKLKVDDHNEESERLQSQINTHWSKYKQAEENY